MFLQTEIICFLVETEIIFDCINCKVYSCLLKADRWVKSKRNLLGSWEYTEYISMHKSIYPVYPVKIIDLELGFTYLLTWKKIYNTDA